MSDVVQQTEQRTCRFPGCERPAVAAEAGTGRPPEYCEDEGHNRAAAWRARRRLSAEPARSAEDEKRPVDAARHRASEIRGQVAGMVEHLGVQLNALVEELRTVADPDAAEAQIESVTSEAAEQVASASARASRAEKAQRQAEAERVEADAAAVEADAAAVEASELAEQQQATLTELGEKLDLQGQALDQITAELAETRTAGEARDRQAQAELTELREQLAATQARLTETERARADATLRAETAAAGRAEADERARGAVARADEEADRAKRAEADLVLVREQLDQLRTEREGLREEISALRGTGATVTVERDAARADAERERAHGDQRVADLRTSQDQQLEQIRTELTEARQEAREQRSRADKAEAQPATAAKVAPGKPASKS